MKPSLLLSLLFLCLPCLHRAWSQCMNPNAQFEFFANPPPPPTIFCEGGVVEIDNKCDETNDPSCIAYMTLNWGDASPVETLTVFTNRTHVYDIPDSIVLENCDPPQPVLYEIKMRVHFHNGLTNAITKEVIVRPKPLALFGIENPICIDDPNQCLTNNSCADSSWMWSIKRLPNGSPGTYTTEEPCHDFNQLGNWQIDLVATNGCGSDAASQVVKVIDTIAAKGSISQLSGCYMMTVNLTDQSDVPPDVEATSRCWKISPATGWMFVDSTNKFSKVAKVKFTQPGDYQIILEVTSVCNTDSKIIDTVHLAGAPSATMNGVMGGCLPVTITPTASNVNYANSNQNNGINWQFPGGSPLTGTGTNPGMIHYNSAGIFPVIMTVTNECGSISDTMQISVGQPADTDIQLPPPPLCAPLTLAPTNNSTGGGSKWWLTHDPPPMPAGAFTYIGGTNSTSKNPQIQIHLPGTYMLHFSLTGAGCGADTAWMSPPFTVKRKPDAVIAAIEPVQCIPASITPFDDASDDGGDPSTTYTWSFPGGTPPNSTAANPGTISYPDTGQFTLTLVMQNSCGADTAEASFYSADLSQVSISLPDTICSYADEFQIVVSPSGGDCERFPGCMFDPGEVQAGSHEVVYTWGSGNCMVQASDQIFVVDETVEAPDPVGLCDTLAPAFQLSGQSPSDGAFSGIGVTPSGWFSPAAAGFGVHEITYSVERAGSCLFTGTTTISIFEPPTAAGSIPLGGCAGDLVNFNVTSASVTKCTWIFGDNTPAVEQCLTQHSYATAGDFIVTLIVENGNGCKDTLTQSIHISQPATAKFSAAPTSGCAPVQVEFTNQSSGEDMQFAWNFDNGDSSSLHTPSPVTYEQGTTVVFYYPTLTVLNGCGNTVFTDTIEVKPKPIADIVVSKDTICSGDTVQIHSNTLGDPLTFEWKNGKGDTYFGETMPDQVYFTGDQFAIFFITLLANNDCGDDADTLPVVVVPVDFEAFFNLDKDTYCQFEQVKITNGATPGTVVSYDFGNGNTSGEADPVHVFEQPGDYKIVQYARTACGVDSFLQPITVLPAPDFNFSHEPEVCQGQPLDFISDVNPAQATCHFDFGDGNSSGNCLPSHSFSDAGDFWVKLTVTVIATGCPATDSSLVKVRPNPVAAFTTPDTVGCGKLVVHLENANDLPGFTHVWTFSPTGNTSTETSPAWLFDSPGWYSVSLQTTDDFGCFDDTTAFELVHVNPVPAAAFNLKISKACELPATVATENQTTGALGYNWQFSTGSQSAYFDTSLVFAQAGNFWARLIAENLFGCADTASQNFTIHPEILADFEVEIPVQCARHPLKVNNLSENTTAWIWQFSNGDTASGFMPNYAFPDAGTFDITLVASLDTVCSDTAHQTAAVQILPSPFAGFEVRDTVSLQIPDGTIVCQDTSSGAIAWLYDFGDGNTSSQRNPVHQYEQPGKKIILQIVENQWKCTDTAKVLFMPLYFDGLFIPTALMPDAGNGEYAVFQPKGRNLTYFRIEIFSPWGEKIWHSEALEGGQPAEFWDGRDMKDGQPVPQGAYVWQVEAAFEDGDPWAGQTLKGKRMGRIGSVTVIR